jgi:hypothetical protein
MVHRRAHKVIKAPTPLTARGFNISDGTSARITACTDLVQLRCWLILAATTQTLENLFNEPVC